MSNPRDDAPANQPYMGVAEVALYLGQSKQTIDNWRKRGRAGFPSPVKELKCGPIWRTYEIIRYREECDDPKR